jgi:hypothetical protein
LGWFLPEVVLGNWYVLLGVGRRCFWNVTYFDEKQREITRFLVALEGFGQFV